MRVLIVNNMTPFIWGGAEELAENLRLNLIGEGHEAEILRVPFSWKPVTRIPAQMQMVRGLELVNVDKVIALKFPAYLIRHPNKTLWLLHQYRQAFDLFDAGQTNVPRNNWGRTLINLIRNADKLSAIESVRVFCNSEITRDRLHHYTGISSEILHPPVNNPEFFADGKDQGYIFAGGRINIMKRQDLLIRALAMSDSSAEMVIAGPPDSKEDADRLVELAEALGVSQRIKFDLRFLPREEYASYVKNCRAVAYIPYDEDSFGYVAMEGALAGKPVITTTDSGGVRNLIHDGVEGWVCHPSAEKLSFAISEATASGLLARTLGETAKISLEKLNLTWPTVIEKLLK